MADRDEQPTDDADEQDDLDRYIEERDAREPGFRAEVERLDAQRSVSEGEQAMTPEEMDEEDSAEVTIELAGPIYGDEIARYKVTTSASGYVGITAWRTAMGHPDAILEEMATTVVIPPTMLAKVIWALQKMAGLTLDDEPPLTKKD